MTESKPTVTVHISIQSNYLTLEAYAERVGVTRSTVYGWAGNGLIKTIKRGKRVLVNMAAESVEAAAQVEARIGGAE